MIEFFSSISDSVMAGISFLGSAVSNLLNVYNLIVQANFFMASIVSFLPQLLGVFASATIAVCIIFFVIGR